MDTKPIFPQVGFVEQSRISFNFGLTVLTLEYGVANAIDLPIEG